jgi:hypothetical protein
MTEIKGMRLIGRGNLADILLITLALIYYASYVDQFIFGRSDEAYLYYVAFAIERGSLPYVDIRLYNYLPGLFYIFVAISKAFGPDILAARVLMMLLMALTPWLLYRCALLFTRRWLALAVALVVLIVPGPWHKFYINLLNLSLLFCALKLLQEGGRRWATVYGLFLGLAFTMRADIAISGVIILGAVWALKTFSSAATEVGDVTSRLNSGLIAHALAGFLIPALPYMLLLAQHGILNDMYLQYLSILAGKTNRIFYADNLSPPAISNLLKPNRAGATAWVYYGSFLPILSLAVLTALRRGVQGGCYKSGLLPSAYLIVLVWALFNVPQYALDRPGPGHIVQRSVIILLPLSIVLAATLRLGSKQARQPVKFLTFAFTALLAVYPVLFVTKHYYYGQGGTKGISNQEIVWHTLSNGIAFPDAKGSRLKDIVEHIIANTDEDERVAAYPFIPGFNFLSQRLMPGRHVFLIPEFMEPGLEEEVIGDLNNVRYAIYEQERSIHRKSTSEPRNFIPEIDKIFSTEFRVVMRVGGLSLLERR